MSSTYPPLHPAPDLAYDVVDVFVDDAAGGFTGNQLAVVHGADGLDEDVLLALTREFGFSETTFPAPGSPDDAAYAVRIFTPGGEIPFAGHPTLGTAWVLHARGLVAGVDLVQHCGAGDVGVRVGDRPGERVELTARPGDLVGPLPDHVVAALLADVGLSPDDRDGDAWLAGTGLDFVHLPVTDAAVARSRPGRTPLADLLAAWTPDPAPTTPVGGLDLYAVRAATGAGTTVGTGSGLDVHARVYVPELSVPEDAATGSSATGLAMALVARGLLEDGGRYRIAQGLELGRPSVLLGRVAVEDGRVREVRVAGGVRPVASGRIAVPAVGPARSPRPA